MVHRRILLAGLNYAPEPSGNAPYTTALSRSLVQRGHSVEVVTGLPHYPSWQVAPEFDSWGSRSMEHGVQIRRLRHYVPRQPSLARRAVMELTFGARAMVTAIRSSSPDIVICVSPALLASALVVAAQRRVSRRPALGLWVQDLYASGLNELHGAVKGGAAVARLERRTMQAVDGVVVAHERFRESLIEGYGVDGETVRVIRNWTHGSPERADTAGARQRFGWGDEVVVLHAGNMGVKQGLENVVEAARLADERRAPVRFVLLGGGNQEARLRDLSRGVERLDFSRSLGERAYRSALAAADVLLVNEAPGVVEMSVPSKLTSYYAAGRPVLAATGAGSVTAQELELSRAGRWVPSGNPAALLEAALGLAADKQDALRLGENGQNFMRTHLMEESAVDRFEDWFEELRKRKGA